MDKTWLVTWLDEALEISLLDSLREYVTAFREELAGQDGETLVLEATNDNLALRRDILLEELDQILASRTLDRARYYLRRLQRGVLEVRTNDVNEINLNRWKDYAEVWSDSLWVVPRRDSSGTHTAGYWGNFIPQIPRQMMWRYTRKGDWVLDAFLGSGTTLIECRRLGRNGIGIELNAGVAQSTEERVAQEPNPYGITSKIVVGDSATVDYAALLQQLGVEQVQLVLLHPPYHDIIQFSEDTRDLSNAASVDDFVARFTEVVAQVTPVLEVGRYLVVVIGDKYAKGEWIPLGFYLMQAAMEQGYRLKSIVVKNFDVTRAKRTREGLWRYRALAGGFYVFKHEYVLVLEKTD